MEEIVEVKTVWSEMVKPIQPTPSHLKTMKLSRFDQMFPLCPNPMLLFYSATSSSSSSSSSSSDELVTKMRSSLSKTLSQFYPLAGRLIDDSTLDCNDKGVLLIHAQVTCPVKSYFSLISKSLFYSESEKQPVCKLLPSEESLHGFHQNQPIPISAWTQLAIQVNVFQCGGIVIGCYNNHKLLDVISLVTFFQYWAGLCKGLDPDHLTRPNFDAAPAGFPPYTPDRSLQTSNNVLPKLRVFSTNSCKPFFFSPTNISSLKKMAASDRTPNPSRVESVVGFLWMYCVAAEGEDNQVGPTALCLTMNMRPRAHPPFPKESMGNMGTNVIAQAHKSGNGLGLTDLVAEIRNAITDFNNKDRVKEFQGDKGGEAFKEYSQMIGKQMFAKTTYRVSCQGGLGMTDVDFGVGKPVWICPITEIIFPVLTNFIYLMDHIHPTHETGQDQVNGFIAWLLLDKKLMHNLETNPDFLAFATPFDPSTIVH